MVSYFPMIPSGSEHPGDTHGDDTRKRGKPALAEGDKFGDCTIVRPLGSGGMGQVYLATSPDGTQYALKLLHPELEHRGADMKRRFLHEAEFLMTIRHRNLVEVFDAGEDPELGLCYILMEYMPGGSLGDMIAKNGRLPVDKAISYISQTADALSVAHKQGVIHRDIKPDNILFTADGVPKLTDLGVARFFDEAVDVKLTMDGHLLGTPAYMAPEQMMDSHHIDARADIYSLGVVLYEMLTGNRPNEGSTVMGLLTKAIKGEPLPDVRTLRPEVSMSVAYVLSLMCAPKPDDRPESSSVVVDLLSRAEVGGLILPDAADKPQTAEMPKQEKPSIFSRLFGRRKEGAK